MELHKTMFESLISINVPRQLKKSRTPELKLEVKMLSMCCLAYSEIKLNWTWHVCEETMYGANCSCLFDIKVCVSKEAATQVCL
jgi:hypothetical protein